MSVIGELLFWSGHGRADLSDVLRHNLQKEIPTKVDRLDASEFDKTDDEITAQVVAESQAEPLVLKLDEADADVRNTKVTVQDHFHGAVDVDGLRVTKIVPFEGEAAFFNLTPSSWDTNPPRGEVRGQKLIVGMEVRESGGEEALQYIEQTLKRVQEHIDRQKGQLDEYNAQLPGAVKAAIQRRRASLGTASDLAARLRGH
jgi:hypothetical protein